ncbi:MAG: arginine--tRNA ligase [Parachlamydiales bacterium]|jgi:arginyl-tRNA synthetase
MLSWLIQEKVVEVLKDSFGSLLSQADWEKVEAAVCQNPAFGHYQCSAPLVLAKELKSAPREIASRIVKGLQEMEKTAALAFFEKIEIAGAGFINFTFNRAFLSGFLNRLSFDPLLGAHFFKKRQRIIVEFSSPNVAKELHVGHLRSTIIGDALARLFEFLGQDVIRLNHIGDWGTQFGMLIAYLEEKKQTDLKDFDVAGLTGLYKAAKKKFDEDGAFKKQAQLRVVALQRGEKQARRIWEQICAISRKYFEEIYTLLDVRIKERGESFYNPELPSVVENLEEQGLIEVSDGAKCLFLEGFLNREGRPLPLMVQKSDGGYNYDTTDIAAMRQRALEEKADRIIVVTDAGQSLHFQMVYAACLKAHYLDPQKTRFDHVPFGLVLGPDGKKFKTREGETEKLIDLLKGAVEKASGLLEERKSDLPAEEKAALARILGFNAIKYADLSCHRVKDYLFSYERMLKFEGNTAAFLLYSYVRILGIQRKIPGETEELIKSAKIDLEHPSEMALGMHLARFAEVVFEMQKELLPNRLCDYLYELAEKFNAFFRDCRVEGDPKQKARLALCFLVQKIFEKGFMILGLKTAERM